jgi:hypothetical protein
VSIDQNPKPTEPNQKTALGYLRQTPREGLQEGVAHRGRDRETHHAIRLSVPWRLYVFMAGNSTESRQLVGREEAAQG